jgi:hypothetical protein
MKKDLENLEDALSPALWSRIGVKVWYLVVIVLVFGAGTKLALTVLYPEEPPPPPPPPPIPVVVVIDHDWLAARHQEVQVLEQEIAAARQAHKRHQDEVKSRSGIFSISRQADRNESDRLNRAVLALQKRRIAKILSYNLEAGKADEETLGELPRELSLEEKRGLLDRVLNRD